jgi:hypothetical protein
LASLTAMQAAAHVYFWYGRSDYISPNT